MACASRLAALQQVPLRRSMGVPYFARDSGELPEERTKHHVVTRYPLLSNLEAIWASRAGTFAIERPRIGRHWNYPRRHYPYCLGTVAAVKLFDWFDCCYSQRPAPSGRCAFLTAHTEMALPFSGTITLVACPCMAAMNFSAVASMIGNDP